MKTGFNDPIAASNVQEKASPWDFRCPRYDERSSCYVDAGSHFGVGHKNPVGHKNGVKERVPTLPFGRVKTMQIDEVPRKSLKQEYLV